MATVLAAQGLSKSFGDLVAVNEVSFEIAEGETFGLLGPNGAGKTTSISMVAGLLEPDHGVVDINGTTIRTRSTAGRSDIGLVPQELAIYPDLTAVENLKFFGRLYEMSGSELEKRTAEVLEVIGLTDRKDDLTKEFSGGMQRRLNIGIGLLHRPRLLILDEPTVGVDPQSRNAILESVEELSGQGIAVLYTTHYMEEAERLCDRVAIIDEGVIKAEGTRRELVSLVGQKDRIHVAMTGDVSEVAHIAAGLNGVRETSPSDSGFDVLADDAARLLPELLACVSTAGASVSSVEVFEPNLEAVFLHLTGKALRD
ncbi:MAG TPA: ABC transporter ATP-binding protein [Acidimicrobiia bacterium]|nr:ABC transporter ATP-binding protein [Acidimicrobiia bacterium]